MIAISPLDYTFAMTVLRSVEWAHPDAIEAADRLQIAALESAARDIEFNTGAPALLRSQI